MARPTKEKIRVIKRDDKIYKEIESFEDYELSQCIAYEMAIRNDDNLQKIENIINYFKNYKEKIRSYEKFCIEIPYKIDRAFCRKKANIKYFRKFYREIKDTELLFTDFFNPLSIFKDSRINPKIYELEKFMEKLIIKYETSRPNILTLDSNKDIFLARDNYSKNIIKIIKNNGYVVITSIECDGEFCNIPINPADEDSEYKEVETIEEYYKFIKDENTDKSCLELSSTIEDNFKRPKLKTNTLLSKNATITLDINKPLNELISYIKHIKKDLENNNILKAPIELFGDKLEKADNLICDSKGKCFDSRETLSKQEKVTDMFYIYDCLKLGMTQRKIQNEVYNYYANKGKEDRTLDAGTLRKYRSIAIDYIDNMKYKELITGVKQA